MFRNSDPVYTVPPVYTEDQFGTIPKFATVSPVYTKDEFGTIPKFAAVPPVYTKDEFGTIPKFAAVPPVYTKDEFGTIRRNRANFGTVPNLSGTVETENVETGSVTEYFTFCKVKL